MPKLGRKPNFGALCQILASSKNEIWNHISSKSESRKLNFEPFFESLTSQIFLKIKICQFNYSIVKCEFLGIRSIKTAGLAKGWPYYIGWWSFLPPLTNREVKGCFISPLILPANFRYKCALFWRIEIGTYIHKTPGIRGSLLAVAISYTCWYTRNTNSYPCSSSS